MEILFIVLIIIASCALIFGLGQLLYDEFGLFKKFYHDSLGYHIPDKDYHSTFDGASIHSKCKYCDKDIMRDSQGNWF